MGTFAFLVMGIGSFLLHVWVGAGPLTSSAVASATATAISYAGNRCWTFRHRQHINLAFVAVRRYGMPAATGKICTWIRHIAAYERAPQKYHHTVSRAWVEIVAHHVGADPDCADFDLFARRNPVLLDKRLLSRHYRSATLASGSARAGWVEPDLQPFPWSAQGTAD